MGLEVKLSEMLEKEEGDIRIWIEKAIQLEDELETHRQRHRTAKDRYQIIQRLRGENNQLRKTIRKKDIQIFRLEDQLRKGKN